MRTELHFNLPEEEPELKAALRGVEYLSRLQQIDEFCRQTIKHTDLPDPCKDKLEHIRNLAGDVWE